MTSRAFWIGAGSAAVLIGLYIKQRAAEPVIDTSDGFIQGVIGAADRLANLKTEVNQGADTLVNVGTALVVLLTIQDN